MADAHVSGIREKSITKSRQEAYDFQASCLFFFSGRLCGVELFANPVTFAEWR